MVVGSSKGVVDDAGDVDVEEDGEQFTVTKGGGNNC